jgi:hypothetical protein
LLILLALALAFALGDYHGRAKVRAFVASGRVDRNGVMPVANLEADLRRQKGLRRMHPNPEEAMRVHKARIVR